MNPLGIIIRSIQEINAVLTHQAQLDAVLSREDQLTACRAYLSKIEKRKAPARCFDVQVKQTMITQGGLVSSYGKLEYQFKPNEPVTLVFPGGREIKTTAVINGMRFGGGSRDSNGLVKLIQEARLVPDKDYLTFQETGPESQKFKVSFRRITISLARRVNAINKQTKLLGIKNESPKGTAK